MFEIDTKTERLVHLARQRGLSGIVLATQANFAWCTGGATNRIDGSREPGAGFLIIAADGRRGILADSIEMPRLAAEVMAGHDFELVEFPWTAPFEDPARIPALARAFVGTTAAIGSDWPIPDTVTMEAEVARLRVPLTPEEIARYQQFGREAGVAIGDLCRAIVPGDSELAIAGRVHAAMARIDARAIVTLVGADDRIDRFRHPVPSSTRWKSRVLVGLCAERTGLVIALSRLICTGSTVEPSFAARTRSAADVFARLLAATRDEETGANLFAVASRAYAEAGFPGEEHRHHQGGAIGYQSRDWIAHPRSAEVVCVAQAFAWNPSITGTKVEDTALVTADGVEILTSSPGWPALDRSVGDQLIAVPDLLVLE
ncbi:MAG: M24 family metallopeptidase [Vicinamibacterales bacterium]